MEKLLVRNNFKMKTINKKSQVWVETAIYTLIGLTIIGILLAVANPQIQKIQDRGMLTQATQSLNDLDQKVSYISQSPGNIAVPQINVGKGKFIINSSNDSISYVLDNTLLEYRQVGSNIKEGNLVIKTEKYGKNFNVYITRYYSGINITYNKDDKVDKFLESSPIPYKIRMENRGNNNIDFNII